jgi:hypothetical protein
MDDFSLGPNLAMRCRHRRRTPLGSSQKGARRGVEASSTTLCGAVVHPEGLINHDNGVFRQDLADKMGFGQDWKCNPPQQVTPLGNPRSLNGNNAIRRRPLYRAQTVPRRRG